MIIRSATKQDLEAWAGLRNYLWPNSINLHRQELKEFYDGTSIDIIETLIGEDVSGKVIAFIEINIRNFAEGSRNPKVPYIEGWYVDQDYQGQGIGKRLMAAAEQWAIEKGFTELASDTELDNHKSIAIHKRLGFEETERVVCFLKTLQ